MISGWSAWPRLPEQEVRQGQKVIEVDPGTNGVIVRTSGRVYTARLVIGADGVYSTVARAVRKPFLKKTWLFVFVRK